jgi:LytS/YehU family sensor histidine kinase
VTTVTLLVGTIITIFVSTKKRLDATESQLQEQRLERERAEKLAAEARLASLASRVQPHFLFNTLNSISALVREDPAQAEQTIIRLSSLLRSSLEGKDTVPLEQELKLVADYLEIQRTRLAERLRFHISDVPQHAPAVPPFAVQTLVENSVRHAGETRLEGVEVEVNACRTNDDLIVDVTDNGSGFDQSELRAGHGLDILINRLRALYGERAALEFERAEHGMTVRLRVPAA